MFAVCLLTARVSLAADAARVVTPWQIVSNTVVHSQRLKMSDREVDAATARRDQARAQALPLLSADAKASRYTGLHDSQFGPALNIPAIENRYGAGVTISQPAYTGGRIKSQKESAAFQTSAARHERRGAEADVVLQASTAYWNWSKAYYSVESLNAAVARVESHAKDMRNLHEAGLATDNDSLATDVMLDQTRLRLEEARRRVEIANARITFLTGHSLPADSIPEQAAPADPGLTTEAMLIEMAQTNRAERAALEMEARAAESQIKAARAEYSPQLSLVARYEDSRPNLMNIPPQDKWQDDAFVGVSVSWNLFDWGLRRAKVAEASSRSAQARLRVEQVEDQIALEVREARIDLQDARQRVTVAERFAESARRNHQSATDLWHNGLARHSDVLDAHDQLTTAEYEIIAARADVALAKAALDHAVGALSTSPPARGEGRQ